MAAVLTILGILLLLVIVGMVVMFTCIRRPKAGEVLVIESKTGLRVVRGSCLVLPFGGNTARCVSLKPSKFHLERSGVKGVPFSNKVRGNLNIEAVIRIANDDNAILKLVEQIGLKMMNKRKPWMKLMSDRVKAAVTQAASGITFGDAFTDPDLFKQVLLDSITNEFRREYYRLDELEVRLTRTPLDCLNPKNPKDQEGIRVTQAEMARAGDEMYCVPGADREFLKGSMMALQLHPEDLPRWVNAAAGKGLE